MDAPAIASAGSPVSGTTISNGSPVPKNRGEPTTMAGRRLLGSPAPGSASRQSTMTIRPGFTGSYQERTRPDHRPSHPDGFGGSSRRVARSSLSARRASPLPSARECRARGPMLQPHHVSGPPPPGLAGSQASAAPKVFQSLPYMYCNTQGRGGRRRRGNDPATSHRRRYGGRLDARSRRRAGPDGARDSNG